LHVPRFLVSIFPAALVSESSEQMSPTFRLQFSKTM